MFKKTKNIAQTQTVRAHGDMVADMVADMVVDMVADMRVDKLTDMVANIVADMKVDMVTNMEVDIVAKMESVSECSNLVRLIGPKSFWTCSIPYGLRFI